MWGSWESQASGVGCEFLRASLVGIAADVFAPRIISLALTAALIGGSERAYATRATVICLARIATTKGFAIPDERSYQIDFDDVTSLVSVDGGPLVAARITSAQIDWVYLGDKWHVDRLRGSWSLQHPNRSDNAEPWQYEVVSGTCWLMTRLDSANSVGNSNVIRLFVYVAE